MEERPVPKTIRPAHRGQRYTRQLLLMLAPYLVGMLLLVALPALLALGMAFFSYDALSPPTWNGFESFEETLGNPLFWTAARNSLLYLALAAPLRLLAALALALLLGARRPGVGLYRAAVYLPTVVPDVAYALIWLWVLNPFYGPLNLALGALGLPAPAWLADPRTALLGIVLMSLFQIGEGLVVLLAALSGVPSEYHQAAALDGASPLQRFIRITLPLIAPWLLLLALRDLIVSAHSSFTPVYLMTGGGPYNATLLLPLLIYEEAFDRLRFGEGAAMLLLLIGWTAMLIWLLYELLGGWGYADEV
jgi:multiple sugar transport system permease protein